MESIDVVSGLLIVALVLVTIRLVSLSKQIAALQSSLHKIQTKLLIHRHRYYSGDSLDCLTDPFYTSGIPDNLGYRDALYPEKR